MFERVGGRWLILGCGCEAEVLWRDCGLGRDLGDWRKREPGLLLSSFVASFRLRQERVEQGRCLLRLVISITSLPPSLPPSAFLMLSSAHYPLSRSPPPFHHCQISSFLHLVLVRTRTLRCCCLSFTRTRFQIITFFGHNITYLPLLSFTPPRMHHDVLLSTRVSLSYIPSRLFPSLVHVLFHPL